MQKTIQNMLLVEVEREESWNYCPDRFRCNKNIKTNIKSVLTSSLIIFRFLRKRFRWYFVEVKARVLAGRPGRRFFPGKVTPSSVLLRASLPVDVKGTWEKVGVVKAAESCKEFTDARRVQSDQIVSGLSVASWLTAAPVAGSSGGGLSGATFWLCWSQDVSSKHS